MKVCIIGAGAAGCFCAIEIKRRRPDAVVVIYEAGPAPLAKVAVTGGGRCNFTNSFAQVSSLKEVYPRGEAVMKRALKLFSQQDCMDWFLKEGVPCVVQEDQCVFPKSQDAMQIVRTLERLMSELGVRVVTNSRVSDIRKFLEDGCKVVFTAGGGQIRPLDGLGINCIPPVPSLFTFRINDGGLTSLMGNVVEHTRLSIPGTAFKAEGTLLVTDWGISGPATLKLSSYAARYLADNAYRAPLIINWLGEGEESAREWIGSAMNEDRGRQLASVHPGGITSRLWKHILQKAGLSEDRRWSELGKKGTNRLVCALTADPYSIEGRCRFKEEFVSCGGVALEEVNLSTLECRKIPGLYFAGEILDIDAVTGGFNLQAAWSTAMTVALNIG